MVKRLIKKTLNIEVFSVLLVIVISALIIIKYFSPALVSNLPQQFYQEEKMNFMHLKYSQELKNIKSIENNSGYASSVPALLYHGITEKPNKEDVSLKNFKEQLFALKKAGWQTITLEDLYKFMKEEKQLPEKSFLLTFDDGIKDSYYPVDPILKALNYTAVMFVITSRSLGEESEKSTYYLSEKELKKMKESKRWEIQAHTRHGHDIYTNQSLGKGDHFYATKFFLKEKNRYETDEEFRERLLEDFIGAKQDIENKLEQKAYAFAFPFNDFGQNNKYFPQVEEIVLDAAASVYELLFYQVWPSQAFRANYPDKQLSRIKRIGVEPTWSANELLKTFENIEEKSLPYIDDFSSDRGWLTSSGISILKNNKLYLRSAKNGTVATISLDGTYLFEDYIFKAKVDYLNATTISLRGALLDDESFLTCDFSKESIFIRQTKDGNTINLYEGSKSFTLPQKNFELGIRLGFDEVECLLDNQTVAGAYLIEDIMPNGGIGIKLWHPKENISKVLISKVSVEKNQGFKVMGRPELFDEIEMKIDNSTLTSSFSLIDKNQNYANPKGTLNLLIKDKEGVLLLNKNIEVRPQDYQPVFSSTKRKKAYRYYLNISNDDLKGARDNIIFAKYIFKTTNGEEIASGIIRRWMPQEILDRENRYLKNSVSIQKTIKQEGFEFTLVRVGKYIPLVDLYSNVSRIRGRRPQYGAPDETPHYRLDIQIKNIDISKKITLEVSYVEDEFGNTYEVRKIKYLPQDKRLTFGRAYLKDNLENIYEIRYENDTSVLDGYYPENSTKTAFILFYMPKPQAKSVDFFYENTDENYHLRFPFTNLPTDFLNSTEQT